MVKALLFISFLLTSITFQAQNSDRIVGTYRVIGDKSKEVSNVKITNQGGIYQAQIVWLEHPTDAQGQLKTDTKNPDATLSTSPVNDVVVIKGIKYDSKNNQWTGGTIYDPASGKTYDVLVEFQDDTNLKVRGYKGTPAFGKTMIWKKID